MLLVQKEMEDLINKYGFAVVKDSFAAIARDKKMDEAGNNWDIYCRNYGFKEEDLGKTFSSNGSVYRLTGIKPSNRKYPILARKLNARAGANADYKFPPEMVLRVLNR